MISFSDTTGGTGIVEQTRDFLRVDATQYPTRKIVNSCNNWHDTITGYAIGADRNFQWDSTNHSKLPIGTTDLTENQVDYSFLTDEQGNAILNLTAVSLYEIATKKETKLNLTDIGASDYDFATYGVSSGTPTEYDKIADNIIRLNRKATAADAAKYKIKFYFQRSANYFTATDTTKQTGVSPLLDRGFVIASAYDGALSLGLENMSALNAEYEKEQMKMKKYFEVRNTDMNRRMTPFAQSNR